MGQSPEISGKNEEFEVIESDERTSEDPETVVEIYEGKVDAGHGQIRKNREKKYNRKTHDEQRKILSERASLVDGGDNGCLLPGN